MNRKHIPVLLLTGYLGSGKTTLLNYILSNEQGLKAAVIVNDIGEVNIDASLIKKGGIVGQTEQSDDLIALQNGCICCTLKMDLIEQISDLAASGEFNYIVIEASGICEPEAIAQTICTIPQMSEEYNRGASPRIDCIATVVDALRMRDEFGCGDSLTKSNITEDDIENLLIQQIEFCNIIILNKISEISIEEAERVRKVIRALQPMAKIIETDYCKIDLSEIISTDSFNYHRVATSAAWIRELDGHNHHEHKHEHHHHEHDEDCHCHCHDEHCHCHNHKEGEADEYGIQTMVYYRRNGFNLNRFDYFITREWPQNIIRTKGVVYFSHNDDMSYLFEQAGRQKKLTQAGLWYASASEQEIQHLLETTPGLKNDWDPKYGDRMIKLVIIGRNLDKAAIIDTLNKC